MAHYRKAMESEPDYPHGYTNLGIALARAGKLDDAIPYFEKAAQLSPWDADGAQQPGRGVGGARQDGRRNYGV